MPILSTSFLWGLYFAVQKHLGDLLQRYATLSTPRTPGPALSFVLGVAGCNSRAGLVRFMLAQAAYDLGHGRNEVVRLAL